MLLKYWRPTAVMYVRRYKPSLRRYITSEEVVRIGEVTIIGTVRNEQGIPTALCVKTLEATQNSTTSRIGSSSTIQENRISVVYNNPTNNGEVLDMPYLQGFTIDNILQGSMLNIETFILSCCGHMDYLYDKIDNIRFSVMETCQVLNAKISITKAFSSSFDSSTAYVASTQDLLSKLIAHSNLIYAIHLDNYYVTFSNMNAAACIDILPRIREIILNVDSMQSTYNLGNVVNQRLIELGLTIDGSEFLYDSFSALQETLDTISMIPGMI